MLTTCISMAYLGMTYEGMADINTNYIVTTCIGMTYAVMAYTVMARMFGVGADVWGRCRGMYRP